MDIKKLKTNELAKMVKLMKADGPKKNSNAAAIQKATKSSGELKKRLNIIKKLDKADPDFDK
ncbi:MAG: hypothetical protein ABJH45_09325 [Paracoccaceae bacterium]